MKHLQETQYHRSESSNNSHFLPEIKQENIHMNKLQLQKEYQIVLKGIISLSAINKEIRCEHMNELQLRISNHAKGHSFTICN